MYISLSLINVITESTKCYMFSIFGILKVNLKRLASRNPSGTYQGGPCTRPLSCTTLWQLTTYEEPIWPIAPVTNLLARSDVFRKKLLLHVQFQLCICGKIHLAISALKVFGHHHQHLWIFIGSSCSSCEAVRILVNATPRLAVIRL